MPGMFHGAEVISLLLTIFWIWMLIDCFRNRGLTGTARLVWVLLILFTHWIGAVLYFIFQRSQRNKQRQTPFYAYYQPSMKRQDSPYNATHTPPSSQQEEVRSSYQQGYQMQQRERTVSPEGPEEPPVEQSHYGQYEQPQATYPEQSQ